jgi:hypothetical protein
LNDEIKVAAPRFAQPVVGIGLDLPGARVTGGAGVAAPDPDVDVLDGDVSQTVVRWEFVEFGDHGLLLSAHAFAMHPVLVGRFDVETIAPANFNSENLALQV